LIGCVWGNGGLERGATCHPITFDYWKGHKPFKIPIEWFLFEVSTTMLSIRKTSYAPKAQLTTLALQPYNLGVVVILQSLLTIKKGTSPSNFQFNEPFLKFIQHHYL
jgi:hypothetical protein